MLWGLALRRRLAMSIVQSGLPLALSIPFILAAWIAFVHRQQTTASPVGPYAPVETGGADPVEPSLEAAFVDLEAVLRDAMAAVEAEARSHWVGLELAGGVAMTVPVNPSALRVALRNIFRTAIHAAPGGRVLVTASTLGSQLQIRITDDGLGANQQTRETMMCPTEASIGLQGGSIAVEARPGRGTSVTIQVPMPASAQQRAGGPVLADQAA
jgi:signal transduction histidine kinase